MTACEPQLRSWSSIKERVERVNSSLAHAITFAVGEEQVFFLEWSLLPGETIVKDGILEIDVDILVRSHPCYVDPLEGSPSENTNIDIINQLRSQFSNATSFPLLLVTGGTIEVFKDRQNMSWMQPEPRFIARPGVLIGLFEVVSGSGKTQFNVQASFRSPLVFPQTTDKTILEKWCPSINHNDKLFSYKSRDYFEVIKTISQNFTKKKNGTVTSGAYGASIVVFPFDLLRSMFYLMGNMDDEYKNLFPLYSLFWREAAENYRLAYERLEDDLRIIEEEDEQKQQEKAGEVTRDDSSYFRSPLLLKEIVWTAPSHILQKSCGMSLSEFCNADVKKGIDIVNTTNKREGPIVLLPAHFHWDDIGWGVLCGGWTRRATSIVNKFIKYPTKNIRREDGIVCISYGNYKPSSEDKKPTKNARLIHFLLRCSEQGSSLDEGHQWSEGKAKSYPDILFLIKPDILIDFIFSELQRLNCANKNSDIHVAAIQHIIQCDVRLMASLKSAASVASLKVLGKQYSTCSTVKMRFEELGIDIENHISNPELGQWDHCFTKDAEHLFNESMKIVKEGSLQILVDDGGFLHRASHASEASSILRCGVEQTTSGVLNLLELYKTRQLYPIVDVAHSWAKRVFESPLIAKAVAERCAAIIESIMPFPLATRTASVIGSHGAIGSALAEMCLSLNVKPEYFDLDNPEELINALNSPIIFGCTGRDVFSGVDVRQFLEEHYRANPNGHEKWFISCSSGDIEFQSLLKESSLKPEIINKGRMKHVSLLNGRAYIFNKGFPSNFDKTEFSVPTPHILLTTMLMAAGIYQAVLLALNGVSPGLYELSPELQAIILKYWFKLIEWDDSLMTRGSGKQPIYSKSAGTPIDELINFAAEYQSNSHAIPLAKLGNDRISGEIHRLSDQLKEFCGLLTKVTFA